MKRAQTVRYDYLLLGGILFLAAFFRLWRINSLTEFLGDQGSAGVVIYEAWQHHSLPLAGPTISTGQRPGPFYYYLIAPPLLLTGFNPLAPAIWMGILGVAAVALIYIVGLRLYSPGVAALLAFLYAVSPQVVKYARNNWNPTTIPVFLLLLIYAMVKIREDHDERYAVLAGLAAGILIQLHYSNIFTVAIALAFLVFAHRNSKKEKHARTGIGRFVLFIGGFLAVLAPFLVYESQNGFRDVRELLIIALLPQLSLVPGGMKGVQRGFLETAAHVYTFVLPVVAPLFLQVVTIAATVAACVRRSFWSILFVMWFFGGLLFGGKFSTELYDHYLFFIMPIPFLLLGNLIHAAPAKVRTVVIGIVCVIGLFYMTKTDAFAPGYRDIPRTEAVTKQVIEAAEGKDFALTIVDGRSHSDFHYRFFLTIWNEPASEITEKDYPLMFIICEKESCPDGEGLIARDILRSSCYEHVCTKVLYPEIFMDGWDFVKSWRIEGATLYKFERRTSPRPKNT